LHERVSSFVVAWQDGSTVVFQISATVRANCRWSGGGLAEMRLNRLQRPVVR
jgi:hypothetical protein